MKKNLRILTYLLLFNFLLVMATMTYWQVVKREEIYLHPRNKRLTILEAKTERGRILDSTGKVLALSQKEGSSWVRLFPYGEVTAHVVGYNSATYGKSGLEYSMNAELLGLSGQEEVLPFLPDIARERTGNDVVTTIDIELQQLAYDLLGNRKGAVAVLDPGTGAILALVSKPSFNPGNVDRDWAALQQEGNGSPLLNRALQGLYPPGSTLKVVTGAGALGENPGNWDRIFNAPGYIIVKGNRINDERIIGKIGFRDAMARSSNYVFATLGLELGAERFYQAMKSFGLVDKIDMELPSAKPIVATPEQLVPEALAETAIGQGKTLVTPLHMALVAATIANGGNTPQPYLVSEVRNKKGEVISGHDASEQIRVVEPEINKKIAESMQAVVARGTGTRVQVPGIKIAGKTGSAENPHGDTHAWFIGFAPADDPQIALAVIVENGGGGGSVAGPVARELFKAAILNKR